MNNAKPATPEQNQRMIKILENLCAKANIEMPRLYVVEDSSPNAFATGRNPKHAVICVTTGILSRLEDYELEGVLKADKWLKDEKRFRDVNCFTKFRKK